MEYNQAPTINLVSGILLLGLATVWGGSFFFAEIALREVPPLTVALHRIFWAVPVLFVVVWWRGIEIPKSINAWLCYLVMGALNNAIPFSLIFWGQVTIESGPCLDPERNYSSLRGCRRGYLSCRRATHSPKDHWRFVRLFWSCCNHGARSAYEF